MKHSSFEIELTLLVHLVNLSLKFFAGFKSNQLHRVCKDIQVDKGLRGKIHILRHLETVQPLLFPQLVQLLQNIHLYHLILA